MFSMRRSVSAMLAVGALIALALLVAGCGSSSDPEVAKLGNASSASTGASSGGSGEGGSGSTGSSSAGGQTAGGVALAGGNEKQMVEFAKCMRKNGVPEFPEPVEGRIEFHGSPKSGLNPGSAQFQAATRKCQQFAPHQTLSPAQAAKVQEQALKFSQCMRSNGLPNFPDPQVEGGAVRLSIKAGSGIDPRSPQFQKAQKECQSQLPFKGAHAQAGGPR